MSLRRRLLLYLLIGAPLVWLAAMAISLRVARHEVDELFDTEMIHLARQVQVTLVLPPAGLTLSAATPREGSGEADMRDLALAVWDREGRLRVTDREGALLPHRPDAAGFVDLRIEGDAWRVYYLQSFDGESLVAAGQRIREREQLSFGLTLGQLLPWLGMLPVLLAAMAWAVRRALAPVDHLSGELHARRADELRPLATADVPAELQPLVEAMNGLFRRIEETLERERRFTADAAHELRTPLAVLRAQWDVLRRATPGAQRAQAEARLDLGLARLDRLVTQMLALARLDGDGPAPAPQPVRWPAIVGQVMSDCLALADQRHIELATEGESPAAFAIEGDEGLLTIMLRNLLDNAVRYASEGSTVLLRLGTRSLEIENDAEPLEDAALARLGERFFRPDGQDEAGSGLGLSIVRRIATMHGLRVDFARREDGRGLRVSVVRG